MLSAPSSAQEFLRKRRRGRRLEPESNLTIELQETALSVKPQVRAACEMLGFDPLYVANEGKLVAFVHAGDADKILSVMRQTRYGEEAVIIGKVIQTANPHVRLKTAIGGTRLIDMLSGEMLPRIC